MATFRTRWRYLSLEVYRLQLQFIVKFQCDDMLTKRVIVLINNSDKFIL